MIADSKAKNLIILEERLKKAEEKYDILSLELVKIDAKSKEWEIACSIYNNCATNIHFINKQIEVLNRTGKMLGDSEEYTHTVIGRPYLEE